MELTRPPFILTDDRARMDRDWIVHSLHETYWANTRSAETILQSLEHSVVYGIYHSVDGSFKQVAMARMVTDHTTFAWLCDVVVDPAWRGQGLGKWITESVVNDPRWNTCSIYLATRDAHTLYERNGFAKVEAMRRRKL